ncbi:zinc finger protein 39-like [Chrysoperla carnea]|uniref:zinc finger protein 39-like n=1 Tax=Chrysoperla carnea TaxID=189513 RepID=UPI001D081BAC|nr:zinc finger protein 39-like [Chrysoperla carnea]
METKRVFVDDFEKVCRICMKFDKEFLSINKFKIIEMIIACASVQIWENDDLPNQICNECYLQLQNTIHFKQLCVQSDNTFREIIEQNKVKIENHSDDFFFEDNSIHVKIEEGSYELDYKNDDNQSINVKIEDIPSTNEYSDATSTEKKKKSLKVYKCEKCQQEFHTTHRLGHHMHQRHKAVGIKCKKCELICYHPLHLSAHEKTHSTSNLSCEICNKLFSDAHKLKRHKFIHGERTFACTKCDLSFKEKYALKRHIKTVHSVDQYEACHVCGKSFKKIHFQKHLDTHGDRVKLSCETCSKQFYYKYNLEQHVKHVHENVARERNHLCNICGMGFQKMDDLRRHFLTHTKEKPYACTKCDKKYRRKYSLTTHISRTHLNERKHICSFCSQAFYNKDMLNNHVRRHTGEKPFKCNLCDKAFIQKISLNLHMKVHVNSI